MVPSAATTLIGRYGQVITCVTSKFGPSDGEDLLSGKSGKSVLFDD
jgi:hypothetical protein